VNITAVIPVRYSSTRLPGKPLIEINKKPLVRYVYERVKASSVKDVIVATDDERILSKVREFGGKAVLTSPHHRSGTERVAEVATDLKSDILVNIQGDEPLINPEDIDRAISPFMQDPSITMTTLIYPLLDDADVYNPHVVKVVIDLNGFALYFSRCPIPYRKELDQRITTDAVSKSQLVKEMDKEMLKGYWQHIGLYAYRRDFLLKITKLPPSPLEEQENLEQLRVLENGYKIKTVIASDRSLGIDTPEDLMRFKSLIQSL
jgi:3-deoxy-manno-octulosonate cytidylyltransferase (CMP-KDO synthetase)